MSEKFKISAATALHKGDRDYQQDQVKIMVHKRIDGCILSVVTDGMGGRSGGRHAADQVIMTAEQLFDHFWPDDDHPADFLRNLATSAHTCIKLTAISSEQHPHCTLVAFLLMPSGECYWVHCGDSRIYLFLKNDCVYKTKDHSYVQTLVDSGKITAEEALTHPKSNMLMSCLGGSDDPIITAYKIPKMIPGMRILACSDGLWHYFTELELAHCVHYLEANEAASWLTNKARERAQGGGDNLSLALIKLD